LFARQCNAPCGENIALSHLERSLQYSDRKTADWLRRKPQTEVRVRLVEIFHKFLKLRQPVYKQMTVLKHQPQAAVECIVEQLKCSLKCTQYSVSSAETSMLLAGWSGHQRYRLMKKVRGKTNGNYRMLWIDFKV